MTKIKICGVTNEKDAMWAASFGVDYIGFNFYKKSPRKVSCEMALKIVSLLPLFIRTVGIFVDDEIKVIKRTVSKCGIKTVQLHGGESADYCRSLKESLPGTEVIKAFRIKDETSLDTIPQYAAADYYLLDTYVPGIEGGTGEVFNWDMAVKAGDFGKPIFLAGGIKPSNVIEAIEKVKPFCIDVASGIEKTPRRKDFNMMHELVNKVRSIK